MTFEELQRLIADDENVHLELKKTTGELKDGMHTACAFLNGAGGWLVFGVAPKSLKALGQEVTDNTQRDIAQALSGLEPTVSIDIQYIDVPGRPGSKVIAMYFGASQIIDACKAQNVLEPTWSINGGFVCVTFVRPITDPMKTPVGLQLGLNQNQARTKPEPSPNQVPPLSTP